MTRTVKLPVWVIVVFVLLFIGLTAYAVLPMLQKEEQLWSVNDWRDYEMYVDNRSDKNIHLTVDESDPDCAAFKERVLNLCTKIKPYRPVLLYYELALGESPDDRKDSSNDSSEYESTRGNFRLINITPDGIVETYYVRFLMCQSRYLLTMSTVTRLSFGSARSPENPVVIPLKMN